jgi:hypothetical protein
MSRLTGKEVYSLMEAYQQVYAPQELTEEQVWEGVENWVNSLLEEGYDLSDYTWEDMYESYLSELTYPDGPAIPTPKPKPIPSSNYNYTPKDLGAKQYADFKFGGGNASVGDSYTAADVVARGRAAKAAAPANPSQYTSKNLGAKQYADFKFGGGDEAIRKGASAGEVVAQGRKNMPTPPSGPKIVGPKIVGPKIVGTGPKNFGSPSLTKKPIMASFDMFDVVLGHLIDEGYADTYEAALTIMTNMSEDWKYSIVEAYEEFPMQKVVKKAGELMGSSAGKNDPKSKKREKRGIKMMNIASTHTPDR